MPNSYNLEVGITRKGDALKKTADELDDLQKKAAASGETASDSFEEWYNRLIKVQEAVEAGDKTAALDFIREAEQLLKEAGDTAPEFAAQLREITAALSDPEAADGLEDLGEKAERTTTELKKISALQAAQALGTIARESQTLGIQLSDLAQTAGNTDGTIGGMISTISAGSSATQEFAANAAAAFLTLGPAGVAITAVTTALSFLSAEHDRAAKAAEDHAKAEERSAKDIARASKDAADAITQQQRDIDAARNQTLTSGQREIDQAIELLQIKGRREEAEFARRNNQVNASNAPESDKIAQRAQIERDRQAAADARGREAENAKLISALKTRQSAEEGLAQAEVTADNLRKQRIETEERLNRFAERRAEIAKEIAAIEAVFPQSSKEEIEQFQTINQLKEALNRLDDATEQNADKKVAAEFDSQIETQIESVTRLREELATANKELDDLKVRQKGTRDAREIETFNANTEIDQRAKEERDRAKQQAIKAAQAADKKAQAAEAKAEAEAKVEAAKKAKDEAPGTAGDPAIADVTGRIRDLARDGASRSGDPALLQLLEQTAAALQDGIQTNEEISIAQQRITSILEGGVTFSNNRAEVSDINRRLENLESQIRNADKS